MCLVDEMAAMTAAFDLSLLASSSQPAVHLSCPPFTPGCVHRAIRHQVKLQNRPVGSLILPITVRLRGPGAMLIMLLAVVAV